MQNKIVGKGAEKKEYCALFVCKQNEEECGNPALSAPVTGGHRQILKKVMNSYDPDIVAVGYPGLSFAAKLIDENKDELLKRFPAWMLDDIRLLGSSYDAAIEKHLDDAELTGKISISSQLPAMIFSAESGGIYEGLWEMGEALFCGIDAQLFEIPMKQAVIEICEYFDLDPYKLPSAGVYLIICKNGQWLSEQLENAGIPSACIGNITKGPDRILRWDGKIRHLGVK